MSAVRPPTDAEVVARSLESPDAFTLIYDRYVGELHGHLAARLGQAEADERALAVFRRAFTKRRKYDERQGTVRDWLYDLASTKHEPRYATTPPTRETVALGRNRLRQLIDTPPTPRWRAPLALAAIAAILAGGTMLATNRPAETPVELPARTKPASLTCAATTDATSCVGPLPAVVSRRWVTCGEVWPCQTSTPPRVRPPRSLPGRIPS
jgi:hypothetical protein